LLRRVPLDETIGVSRVAGWGGNGWGKTMGTRGPVFHLPGSPGQRRTVGVVKLTDLSAEEGKEGIDGKDHLILVGGSCTVGKAEMLGEKEPDIDQKSGGGSIRHLGLRQKRVRNETETVERKIRRLE